MLLVAGYHCSVVGKLKVGGGHAWTERPLRIIEGTRRAGQAIGRPKAINLSQMTNKYTGTVCMDRSFPSVVKAVLNYAGGV